jgi:A/G-specific adenine glycosylase
MLQQTRVETVIPYYRAFLSRFPDAATLGNAPETDVLTAWAGLGYYSRARNLRLAAAQISARQPRNYAEIRRLPGVGPYTAAALASISLNEPYAAVDGNVLRVVSRIANDPGEISSTAVKKRFDELAGQLLDPERPGDFNQAMMELGATICVPASPACGICPVSEHCQARMAGTQRELPVKQGKPPARKLQQDLLFCEVDTNIYLVRRSAAEKRMAGFWELPPRPVSTQDARESTLPAATFTHQIVNDRFEVRVWTRYPRKRPAHLREGAWIARHQLTGLPISTITKKALAILAAPETRVLSGRRALSK